MSTKIEWTDETWNPITGCTEVSPGCDHCYAKTFAERWRGVSGHHFENGFDVTLRPERLGQPRTWKKPRRVFVNSMSDLFHASVGDEFVARVWMEMLTYRRHTFQVLTKRPERMRRLVTAIYENCFPFISYRGGDGALRPAIAADDAPNIWVGVSIESNAYAWRADMLRKTPAAVRFLSIEPMLGPVDAVDFAGIDWVIVGGESGPGARPMSQVWALDVRDRCIAAGIPYFFKQWGSWKPIGTLNGLIPLTMPKNRVVVFSDDGSTMADGQLINTPSARFSNGNGELMERARKDDAGRILGGRTWDEFPLVRA